MYIFIPHRLIYFKCLFLLIFNFDDDSVRSASPGLKTKRTGLLLSGPKLCSLIKVNFAFPLEIRVPESGGREERHRIHVA